MGSVHFALVTADQQHTVPKLHGHSYLVLRNVGRIIPYSCVAVGEEFGYHGGHPIVVRHVTRRVVSRMIQQLSDSVTSTDIPRWLAFVCHSFSLDAKRFSVGNVIFSIDRPMYLMVFEPAVMVQVG